MDKLRGNFSVVIEAAVESNDGQLVGESMSLPQAHAMAGVCLLLY